MELPQRPISILIAALGGEGGGVLADWILAAATSQNYPVQSTSIPGVAQRTGATTYYVELYPARIADLGGRCPVMPLAPAPGCVDVLLSSELLEAGRAMLNGFVTPERTMLIASTHRIYTVAEKTQMGDGRFDTDRLVKAAHAVAKRAILFDMQSLAAESGTVISAVLFGAIAGSGALPLSRDACEDAIRKAGKGAESSLNGFALGYAHASGDAAPMAAAKANHLRAEPLERVRNGFPAETHALLEEGAVRCIDFQDRRYGNLYLDRLDRIMNLDREMGGGANGYRLTSETGRFLALWMCFEDVIRVADLKSRRSRFERVRTEVQAKPGEPLHIIEYLKPGVEEAAALLPPVLSKRLVAWAAKHALTHKLNVGLYIKTTSVTGFLMLRLLAALRALRRMSTRYIEEQAAIESWLAAVASAGARDLGLALEIALCGRLIKGYGETHRRGKANFLRIMDTLVEGNAVAADRDRATAIREAREAALADPEGRGLEGTLATHGIVPLPPQLKPIRFMRRPA